ncbi:hypothetical protein GOODEAATRI_012423, partial [Goodea atripinnis]
LSERGAECREMASLCREVEELRTLTRSQEQKVAQSHREAEQSQAELASMEAILALLHQQEVGKLLNSHPHSYVISHYMIYFRPICLNPCMLPPVDYSGAAHLLKLKPGEGYQQLLRVLQLKEAERLKQKNLNERLQERLSRAQEEISTLQSSMAQRASHYQSLHTELLDKVSQATDTQKELKRKSARVAALEKQLQEKSSAYSLAALKNTELENELKLQLSVEEAQSQMVEMEQHLGSLQRERDEAQKAAVSSLELQLERDRASLQGELRSRELEAQAADKNLQEMTQHNKQLSKSIRSKLVNMSSKIEELGF